LAWVDNATNETGFELERATASTGPWAQVAAPAAKSTSFDDSGLTAASTYWYRLRASNASGESAYAGPSSATTSSSAQTVDIVPQYMNCGVYSTLDPSSASKVFANCYPTVGINSFYSLLGFGNWQAFASAVRFDLSSLAGKTIDSATLTLISRTAPVGYYKKKFQVAAIASPAWNSSTVTWNLMAQFRLFQAVALDYPTYPQEKYTLDVTGLTRSWVASAGSNNGLAIQSQDYTPPGNVDSLDAYDFLRPILTVTYH
jgi:hypothetical protein